MELEKDKFESDTNLAETKAMLEKAASRYLELHNSKPVTLRINQLIRIKA